jgi:hypothetical protein
MATCRDNLFLVANAFKKSPIGDFRDQLATLSMTATRLAQATTAVQTKSFQKQQASQM